MVRMTRTLRNLLLITIACVGLPACAQVSGTITGRTTDATGAVVPNVNIRIVSEATGNAVRALTSNSDGIYSAPNLPIGKYDVRADLSGFKSYERTGIVVNVDSTVSVNIPLAVGSVTESVTVQADQIQIQAATSDVSTVISGTQINEIDTNGRDVFELAALAPGVSNSDPEFQNPVAINDYRAWFSTENAPIIMTTSSMEEKSMIAGAVVVTRFLRLKMQSQS